MKGRLSVQRFLTNESLSDSAEQELPPEGASGPAGGATDPSATDALLFSHTSAKPAQSNGNIKTHGLLQSPHVHPI